MPTMPLYQNVTTGQVLTIVDLRQIHEVPKGAAWIPDPQTWERVRVVSARESNAIEPGLVSELLDLAAPSPGIRLSIEFVGEGKRYGVALPGIYASAENAEALEAAVVDLVSATIRLHAATSAGTAPRGGA